jgi:signal transduction histidine kinase
MSVFEVRDRSWLFDFSLAVATSLLVIGFGWDDVETGLAAFVLAASLLFRRSNPTLALGIGIVGALALLGVATTPPAAIAIVPMLVYSMARWSGGRRGLIALVAGLFGAVLGPLRWTGSSLDADRFAPFVMTLIACAAIIVGAYLLGSRLRESRQRRRERQAETIREQQLVEAELRQRAQVASISERNRIARELHDIVAHSLSVIVVQAEGGRALAAKRPAAAPEVFATIAETGRQALAETRHIVGLLRGESGPSDPMVYAPTPGLDDLADLVRRTSDAYELSVFGSPPAVSQALGLTVYRIVQESLTNVLKHAGPSARARVTVAFTAEAIEIEVVDDGMGVAAPSGPSGHGHEGMRERVAVHGGQLSVGPRVGGGFAVRAWLPLQASSVLAAG